MLNRLVVILVILTLISCGGSSEDGPEPELPPPPPIETIVTTQTEGVITGFGSVYINGVKYETDQASISTDDDENASESDLQVGMVVSLSGQINSDGNTGKANSIHYEEQIRGPLESIDLAQNTLIILGQTVLFDELTNIDGAVLADLLPGDYIELSGFINSEQQWYATRIKLKDDSSLVKIIGIVSMLDEATKTFKLGEITINYSSAHFENLDEDELVDGLRVRVKGEVKFLVDGILTINHISSRELPESNANDQGHLEGIITSFESSDQFVVNGVTVVTDSNTSYKHGSADSLTLNIRVKIKGNYLESGELLAQEIRVHKRTNLKLEGYVQAVDIELSTVTVFDVTFLIDEQTKLIDKSDNDERIFDITDLMLEDFIEVKGFIDVDGNKIATKLERENDDSEGVIELKGTVSNIIDTSFEVVGVVVNTTEETKFEGLHGDEVNQAEFFEQLADGMTVEVKGQIIDDEFIAIKVELDGEDDDDKSERSELKGIVEEIADGSYTISGKLVLTTSATEYEYNDQDVTAEAFLLIVKVGDQVKVKGEINDGIITAKSIELEIEHQQGAAEVYLYGRASYENEVLTVHEHVIEIDDKTHFKGLSGQLSFEEFIAEVNDWLAVKVKGDLLNDVIFAKEVKQVDNEENNGNISIEGKVEEVLDNTLIISGHEMRFTDDTEFKLDDKVSKEAFFTAITQGDKVEATGNLQFEENGDGMVEFVVVNEIKLKG